ncbi:hypothetical protein Btru_055172 [Bulinus truncatus]|nr:hypothetical protein Btru_055172 [Bulinus truncatus]
MSVSCQSADTYSEYIANNRDYLKDKCSKLTDCIDKLLSDGNTLTVIKGEHISLNKTCGLIYKPENTNYTTLTGKCSATEREEIREDLETNLQNEMDKTDSQLKDVKNCLEKIYKNNRTTRVEEICLRARVKNEICNKTTTHKSAEVFFNKEIQNLQCKCKHISQEDGMPLEIIVGIGAGSFIILIFIFLLIFCCYWRKQKLLKRKKTERSVVYVPGGGSDAPVYQEVNDDKSYRGYQQSPSGQPPALPSRLISQPAGQPDGIYLEPVIAGMKYRPMPPVPQQMSNPGYDNPPRYSQCDIDDADSGYFQPMPDPVKVGGLTFTEPVVEPMGIDVNDARSSIPSEDAPFPSDAPLGPVPAKRTKKDDRQVESHYFLLEDGNVKDGGDNA